jgi:hypothetical protein
MPQRRSFLKVNFRKPAGHQAEWKREDVQNSSSWFHGCLIKKRRSSPCLRDSVVMPVLVGAPPRRDLLFQSISRARSAWNVAQFGGETTRKSTLMLRAFPAQRIEKSWAIARIAARKIRLNFARW